MEAREYNQTQLVDFLWKKMGQVEANFKEVKDGINAMRSVFEFEFGQKIPDNFSLPEFLSEVRSKIIDAAILQARGNLSEAARLLGVSPQAMHKEGKKKIAPPNLTT